jgi:isocitrate lyase
MRVLILPVLPLALSGCVVASVAGAAVDVATLPVKAVSKGVDVATTSQSEADQKRGRELRQAEEKAGKRDRLWAEQCRKEQERGEPCPPRPADPMN